jgi:hypothetical protein
MNTILYCTPEWLEETAKKYPQNPQLKQQLKKLSIKLCFRVRAEPAWGIDDDIIFGMFFEQGDLTRIEFFDEQEALSQGEYVLAATPQEWKRLLCKESKFVTDFMLGKVTLEHGSRVGILGVAPHANTVVDALTQVNIQFPDEMAEEEVAQYRMNMKEFRKKLSV